MTKYPWALIKRTQRLYPIHAGDTCERCGSRGNLTRHHKDRDRGNNAPDNIVILCLRCHIREHIRAGDWGRMKGRPGNE